MFARTKGKCSTTVALRNWRGRDEVGRLRHMCACASFFARLVRTLAGRLLGVLRVLLLASAGAAGCAYTPHEAHHPELFQKEQGQKEQGQEQGQAQPQLAFAGAPPIPRPAAKAATPSRAE